MYYLFLDDIRYPKDVKWVELPLVEWVIVRNYNEFIKTIKKDGLPEFISFDHDLGIESMSAYNEFCHNYDNGILDNTYPNYITMNEKTGFHCAKWLVEYCMDNKLKLPEYTIHSINIVGKSNIIGLLENFKKFSATIV